MVHGLWGAGGGGAARGAFLGGVSVSGRLRRSLLVGLMAGAVGFGGFAISPSMSVGCVCLFVGGFGLGQIITSVNILAGRRFTAHRGSALSMLNFSFSLGAMLSALLAAWLLPRFALRDLLEGFATLFAVGVVALISQMRGNGESAEAFDRAAGEGGPEGGLSGGRDVCFGALLVLDGGLGSCLSGWVTTFGGRDGGKNWAGAGYTAA